MRQRRRRGSGFGRRFICNLLNKPFFEDIHSFIQNQSEEVLRSVRSNGRNYSYRFLECSSMIICFYRHHYDFRFNFGSSGSLHSTFDYLHSTFDYLLRYHLHDLKLSLISLIRPQTFQFPRYHLHDFRFNFRFNVG
jgi:hypothetical protein